MIEELVRIVPARAEDMEMVRALAAADDHSAIAATWLVKKQDQVIGCIGTTPCVHLWMDTQRSGVRDSIMVANFFENMLAATGAQIITVPVPLKSPFLHYMVKAGYVDGGESRLFLKNLTL